MKYYFITFHRLLFLSLLFSCLTLVIQVSTSRHCVRDLLAYFSSLADLTRQPRLKICPGFRLVKRGAVICIPSLLAGSVTRYHWSEDCANSCMLECRATPGQLLGQQCHGYAWLSIVWPQHVMIDQSTAMLLLVKHQCKEIRFILDPLPLLLKTQEGYVALSATFNDDQSLWQYRC